VALGFATVASVFVASLDALRNRPGLAFIATLGAVLCWLFVGMVTAIELGLLRP